MIGEESFATLGCSSPMANAEKKRTSNNRQTTTAQHAPLIVPDAFPAALEGNPSEDRRKTWAAGRTIMLRRTSKRVKEKLDKMRLPALVCLSRSFWDDARNNGTGGAKLQFVWRQLAAIAFLCRITILELPECEIIENVEQLTGLLAQFPVLTHLDLRSNSIPHLSAIVLSTRSAKLVRLKQRVSHLTSLTPTTFMQPLDPFLLSYGRSFS